MLFIWIISILIEVYGIGLQIGGVVDAFKGNRASRVYLHMIRVISIALEEPQPTRTGAGTAAHLLFVHPLSIDV